LCLNLDIFQLAKDGLYKYNKNMPNKLNVFKVLLLILLLATLCVVWIYKDNTFRTKSTSIDSTKSLISSGTYSTYLSSSSSISLPSQSTILPASQSSSGSTTNLVSSIYQSVSTIKIEKPKALSQIVIKKPVNSAVVAENNKSENKVDTKIESAIAIPKVEVKKEPVALNQKTNYKSDSCETQKANQMLEILNNYRVENAKPRLTLISDLNQIACAHSKWMSKSGNFSHTGIDQTSPFDRCKLAQTYCLAENIAQNSLRNVQLYMNQFKNSPGHNTNMLNGDYIEAGFGFDGDNVTQIFR
jgi:uncharacterized protein YkwD